MSWQQLLEIMAVNRQDVADFERLPLVACPNDGWPLEEGPDGELHCQFGGEIYSK
jgi:hypothetical protein